MKKNILCALLSCAIILQTNAAIIYVNDDATGLNTGTSWTNAFTDLQSAFVASFPGDEIWVAAGVYKPFTAPDGHFDIPNTIKLYGGFAGTETMVNQRNITLNESILSGDVGVPGVSTDNADMVVHAYNVGAATRLDGFKIANARSDGGVLIYNSSITVANCIIIANHSDQGGGGINKYGSGAVTLINCKITNNTTSASGGGIAFDENQLHIINCDISDNNAIEYAGGVYVNNAVVTIDRSIFSGNVGDNGGAFAIMEYGEFEIYNSLIVGNQANIGAVFWVWMDNSDSHTIWNSTIAHNKSSVNGTFRWNVEDVNMRNSIFWGDDPYDFGSTTGGNIQYCIVDGGFAGGSNISAANPQFILPGSGTLAPFNASAYNYRLPVNSPGVNSGSNTFMSSTYNHDLDDSARISGTKIDIGCYERYFCTATASITPSGATSLCTGDNVTLTATTAASYAWSTGATTQSITVGNQGTYTVSITDAGGCTGSASQLVTVTTASVQINGSTSTFCTGESLTLSATTAAGSSFLWSSGATTQNITVSQPGTYTVTVTTSNGCTAVSSPRTITEVQSTTASVTAAASETSICGGEAVTFTASPVNGGSAPAYVWKKNGSNFGTGNPFVTSNLQDRDDITVEMNSSQVCALPDIVSSAPIEMTVTTVPTPTIYQQPPGNILTSSAPTGNQWYVSGSMIPGATGTTITTQQDGNYLVIVTINGCPSTASNIININTSTVGISSPGEDAMTIYPNPVRNELTIQFENREVKEVRIYNTTGQLMKAIRADINTIDVHDLASGFYLLEVQCNEASRMLKFVKMEY